MKMTDFDLILIKEYEKRHGLYDQNSSYYKDKLYSENAWREIAIQLNCNVSLLKVRMIQLRCRYNNEKRKYDMVRRKHPDARVSWVLFEHLQFLNNHIKQRKRYKTSGRGRNFTTMKGEPYINPIARRRGRPPKNFSYAELPDETQESYEYPQSRVKDESSSTSVNDEETFVDSSNFLEQATYISPDSATDPANPQIRVNPNTQLTNGFMEPQQVQHQSRKRHKRNPDPHNKIDESVPRFSRSPDKFNAFGQFVTASLREMTEEKSLELVESFTVQLVRSMKSSP